MEKAGCDLLFDMERISVIGLDGLWGKLFDILGIRKQLKQRWQANPPSIFIAVDVPDFNLTLESQLKTHGIPCLHYVSPTVWAWRGYRIHKIKRSVNHMLAMFPFEAEFYRKHEVPVTCVGHPLADEISEPDSTSARQTLGLGDGLLVALLPGSRRSEVKRLAGPMVEAARILTKQNPDIRFVLPFAGHSARKAFNQYVGSIEDLPITILDGQSRLAMEAADVAILASGTASLEAALLRLPHVVVYRLSWGSYCLMLQLRHVDHYAMPNHLLPKPMVPELIQHKVTPHAIVDAVNGYLQNPQRMQEIKQAFAKIHQSLKLDADKRAADAVISMLQGST
jgi:lipid-A-disaccharide synthase